MSRAEQNPIYCFGPFELDPQATEQRRDGRPLRVQRRVFDLLLYPVENRDRVVSRQELLAPVDPIPRTSGPTDDPPERRHRWAVDCFGIAQSPLPCDSRRLPTLRPRRLAPPRASPVPFLASDATTGSAAPLPVALPGRRRHRFAGGLEALPGLDVRRARLERHRSGPHAEIGGRDPRHPARPLVWINCAPVDALWDTPGGTDMRACAQIADVVGFDFYPVATGLPWPGFISRSRLEDFGWYVDRVRSWVDPGTPLWVLQQGHRKGDLLSPPTPQGRRPDGRETRFMSFQALVHGATGVFFFPVSRLGYPIPYDDPTWDLHIRETAATVRALRRPLGFGASTPGGRCVEP